MEWWSMTPTEVLKKLRTEERTGLSENEAQKRLETDGRNRTEQGEGKKGFQRRFLAQFNDFMILLLIGAAVASVAISYWNGEKDFLDAAIILAIVALNAFLGVLQESRAEKALEALKALSAPKASVLRNGEEKEIPAEEVVQGDILLLAAGDYICADGRILENQGLKTEESAITGEALAIEKEEDVLAEKHCRATAKHGACRKLRSRGERHGCGDGNGHGDRNWTDCSPFGGAGGARNALAEKTGGDRKAAWHGGADYLRHYLRDGAFAKAAAVSDVYDLCEPCGGGNSRRTACDCDDCACDWDAADGKEKYDYPQTAGGGNLGERRGHLLG